MSGRLLVATLALVAVACGESRTLLTVDVHADRTVPDGLDRLCLTARDPEDTARAFGYDARGESFGDAKLPGLPATIVFEDAHDLFEELVVTGTGTWQGLPAGFGAGRWSMVDHDERTVTMRVHACGPNRVVPLALQGPIAALDPTTAGRRRAVLADLDADGRAELLEAPSRAVLLSAEEPQDVTSNYLLSPPIGATAVAVGDLDHDCAPDVLFASPEGVFAPLVSAPGDVPPFHQRGQDGRVQWPDAGGGAIAIGDVDDTGAVDVFVAGAGAYHVLRAGAPGDGAVEFGDASAYVTTADAPDGTGSAVALADITDDGALDAIVGHSGFLPDQPQHAVRVFEGRNETLAEVRDALPMTGGRDVAALAVGPLDGDETPDVLVVLAGDGPVAALWTHDSAPTEPRFARAASPTFPNGDGRDVVLVDLDGDCDLDVVIAVGDGPSLVFEQTRDGLVPTAVVLPSATAVAAGPTALDPYAELDMVVVLLDDEGEGSIFKAGP